MTRQLSLPRDRISVLLLEGISQTAVDYFSSSGYTNLIHLPKALDDKDLKSHIADAHIIGIRSRTQLTDEVLESAKKLIAVGESKADPTLDPSELAAWTMLANQLMNLDEVLNK